MHNGVIGNISYSKKTILDRTHPPVVQSGQFLADQGTLPQGLIVAKNGDNLYVPYAPTATNGTQNPKGVLTDELDTTQSTTATVLKHGTVVEEALLVGTSDTTSAPTEDDLSLLSDITIYAV